MPIRFEPGMELRFKAKELIAEADAWDIVSELALAEGDFDHSDEAERQAAFYLRAHREQRANARMAMRMAREMQAEDEE